MLWLRPLKKKGAGVQPKVPQIIAEYDGGGSDAYAGLRRLERFDPVEEEERGRTPLFRKMSADALVHFCVKDMRASTRKRLRGLGYE